MRQSVVRFAWTHLVALSLGWTGLLAQRSAFAEPPTIPPAESTDATSKEMPEDEKAFDESAFVGRWDLKFTTPDGMAHKATVKVSRDGDAWRSEYTEFGLPAEIVVEVKGTKVEGNKWTMEIAAIGATVTFVGKLDGQKLGGDASFQHGSTTGNWTFAGERSENNDPMNPILGTWQIEFTTPDGKLLEPKMTVQREGDYLKGSIDTGSTEYGEATIKDISFQEQLFRWVVVIPGGEVTFESKPDQNRVEGTATFLVNGDSGTFPFKGHRSSQP
jgi:hypothetical protein